MVEQLYIPVMRTSAQFTSVAQLAKEYKISRVDVIRIVKEYCDENDIKFESLAAFNAEEGKMESVIAYEIYYGALKEIRESL